MAKKETKDQSNEEEKKDQSEPADAELELTNPKTSKEEDGKETTRKVAEENEDKEQLEVKPEQIGSPSLEQFLQKDDTKAPDAGDPQKAAEDKVKSVLEQEKNS